MHPSETPRQGDSLLVRYELKGVLKQLDDSWTQLENGQGDQDAASIFQNCRNLLVNAASVNSPNINRELAAQILAKLSYFAPHDLWLDVTVRRRVVDLVEPPQSPAALNTASAVPWQKQGAQFLENVSADERVAKVFMQRQSDDDPDAWHALTRSASPPRASVEKAVSLGAIANLATIPSNSASIWRDADARKALTRGVGAQGVGSKPVRQSAERALSYLAEDPAVRAAMADCEHLEPFWRHAAAKKIADSSDNLIEYALALLAKLDGVECTGERSKADIDLQKHKAAIDLEDGDEDTGHPRTPAKRVKTEAPDAAPYNSPRIGPPSSHNGTRDSNAALGSSFRTAGLSNAAAAAGSSDPIPAFSSSGAGSSSGAAGPSGAGSSGAPPPPAASVPAASVPAASMASLLEELTHEFPACRGLAGVAAVEYVETQLYGEAQSGSLKRRARQLVDEMRM